MKRTILAVATAALLGPGLGPAPVHSRPAFEEEPVLRAADFFAPDLLKGPRYTVAERTPVRGMLARFTIQSDFGPIEAAGVHMLQVRAREVGALAELEKLGKTREFAEAAGRAAVRPVTSAANMLARPVETLKGIPDGASRLFERAKLGGASVMEAATGSGKKDEEKAAEVTQRVGSITVDVLGFEKERRDLARSLGVDPYTTNPILAQKLTDAAWVAFSGRAVIQAATAVVMPYSMAMSAVTITNSAVYDTPAGDLFNRAAAAFRATGATEAQVGALLKNPNYSLSVLTAMAMGIDRLRGVGGLPSLVEFGATAARTEDEARFVAAAVNMLARHHESAERLAAVAAPGPIVGRTAGGTLVVPAPVDYVAWTERVARVAQRADLTGGKRVVWLSGRMSARARREFTQRGWVVEEAFTNAAER